jgi:hypothetical protein
MNEHDTGRCYEEKEIRCPRLGGPVTFSYCRIERGALPCPRALDCWARYFDVEALFRQLMSNDEFADCFFRPAQPKVVTLLEMIEKARRVLDESRDDKN